MESGAKLRSPFRIALPQIMAIMVKNVLLLGYGMTMGFPTILIPYLSQRNPGEDIHLTQEDISWIGSIAMLCVPAGCIFSGLLTPPIGRKKSMQIICSPFLICAVIFKYSDDTWEIYLALALIGFAGGFMEAPVITYVAEITQPQLRGSLSATGSLAVLLGNFIEFVLGTFYNWRTVALLSGIPSTVAFCLLYFIPESPQWLITQNRHDDARKSLVWLRGWVTLPEIEDEFQALLALQKNKNLEEPLERRHFFTNYTKKTFLRPLALISFIFFLANFTGMTTLQTYSVHIFETLRSPINGYYSTILVGAAQFLGTLFCVVAIHFIGKRVLVFCSLGIASISFAGAATYAFIIGAKYFFVEREEDNRFSDYTWISIPCLVITAFALQGGVRVLPWILIGEMYTAETRAMGSGISGAIAYIFGFLANKMFLQAVANVTLPGTFCFYSAVSLIGLGVLYGWLPETEGKTLEEISGHFEGITKLDNKIRKRPDCKQTSKL